MAKAKTHYTCQACGYQSAKWLGKCPDCGAWSSLVEETAGQVRKAGGKAIAVVCDAGLEEDARYDDQDAVDPAEVANGRRLIGDAVLAAQDGQHMRIAASGTDVYEGLIRILRLDAQQHHVLVGKADVLDQEAIRSRDHCCGGTVGG